MAVPGTPGGAGRGTTTRIKPLAHQIIRIKYIRGIQNNPD
jgi:hypothetical protein